MTFNLETSLSINGRVVRKVGEVNGYEAYADDNNPCDESTLYIVKNGVALFKVYGYAAGDFPELGDLSILKVDEE